MRLKLYRAPSVAAAMALVRAELGDDALILTTRRTAEGVEVTAALEPAPAPITPPDPARLAALRFHGVPAPLAASLAAGPFEPSLQTNLRFAPIELGHRAPLLLAGPPGAGKTLTVARLATRLVMQGRAPLVVCTDEDRAGAAEQLAAFTRVLGIGLVMAPDPVALARAVARRQDGEAVLIDTAGIDPFSPADQARIAALANVAGARTALALPAGLDAQESADIAAAFAAAGAALLVATRMDVARRIGGILAAAAALPLAEAGVGPGAADGLRPMTPGLLAARLLPDLARKAA